MKILVNGKEAVLKADSSFEYVSENPLFTDAEDYSLEIEFPMKDCPQNILIFGALHVKGVDISTISYPCKIITESFDKTGFLAITEVNDVLVKGQFLEGMSAQFKMEDVLGLYLDEIDFSAYDGTDGTQESLERVDGSGWADLLVYDKDKKDFYRIEGDDGLIGSRWMVQEARHIYLKTFLDVLAEILGVSIDYSYLESLSVFRGIIIANATYEVSYSNDGISRNYGYYMQLEKSLPHWSIKTFFDELGKFFGCVTFVDSYNRRLRVLPNGSVMGVQRLSLNVLDDFVVELNSEDVDYVGNKVYTLPDECNEDNLNMCPWISRYISLFTRYNLSDLTRYSQYQAVTGSRGWYPMHDSNVIFPVDEGNNIWAVVLNVERRNDVDPQVTNRFAVFEIINQFGDHLDGDELKILPCPLKFIKLKKGYKFDGSDTISSYLNYSLYYKVPFIKVTEREFVGNSNVKEVISDGDKKPSPYDQLYLVLHSGTVQNFGYHINTRKYEVQVGSEYADETVTNTGGDVPMYCIGVQTYENTLSPFDSSVRSNASLPRVDESKLYRYKFLSKTLPDPKAIYVIKGKRYACLRLTAHFTVDGMSELIEGEFYEIVG